VWNLGLLAGEAREEAPEAGRDPHKDQKAPLVRSNYMNCHMAQRCVGRGEAGAYPQIATLVST
jgi:hypothetical protein